MKKLVLYCAMVLCMSAVLFGCTNKVATKVGNEMKVTSSGIVNGVIDDKYGVNGGVFSEGGIPSISVPLKIENAPAGTVSYAVVIEDKDAFPVSHGFAWIHWAAANITDTNIPENASRDNATFVQGVNSWWSPQGGNNEPATVSYYGGMYPPANGDGSGDHIYEFHVYALDKKLELQNGFWLNNLYRGMDGHILGHAVLKGTYKNKGEK